MSLTSTGATESSTSSGGGGGGITVRLDEIDKEIVVQEIVKNILPRCILRPGVYNMVAAIVKHLKTLQEAEAEGADQETLLDDKFSVHSDLDTAATVDDAVDDDDEDDEDDDDDDDEDDAETEKVQNDNDNDGVKKDTKDTVSEEKQAGRLTICTDFALEKQQQEQQRRRRSGIAKSPSVRFLPDRKANTVPERLQDVKVLDRILSSSLSFSSSSSSSSRKEEQFIRLKLETIQQQLLRQIEHMQALE